MRNGSDASSSALWGDLEQIEVDRALGELRGGRPILVTAPDGDVLALPLEGLTEGRLDAFRAFCVPESLSLIVTARRARALGLDTGVGAAIEVPHHADAASLLAIALDRQTRTDLVAKPAGQGANAAVELVKIAQSLPAVLVSRAGRKASAQGVVVLRAGAVAGFKTSLIHSLAIASEARVPLSPEIATRFVIFRDATGDNSVAVIIGEPDLSTPVTVRLHSACLTGDVFGSRRCDCGDQLRLALDRIYATGGGVILYLAQEGRGLGLVNKMRAYRLQDTGLDTIDANNALGFDDDERDYGLAARMLEMLGIHSVKLMTNNPAKVDGLMKAGIEVTARMPVEAPVNPENRRYLAAKAARAGHQLDHFIAALGGGPADRTNGNGRAQAAEALSPANSQN